MGNYEPQTSNLEVAGSSPAGRATLQSAELRALVACSEPSSVAKKEGAGGLSSGPSFLAACGLGGRGIGRHQLLMSAGIAACRAEGYGGALLSALTISKKQFTINLASRVQLG